MRQRQDLELKEHVMGLLELYDEWTKAEFQETEGYIGVGSLETSEKEFFLEDCMRKASLDYPGDQNFIELFEKYVQVLKNPILFDNDDGSSKDGRNDKDENDDDEGNNGNGDEEVNDKEPYGSDAGPGFSKVSLEDFKEEPSGSDADPNN
ncbi:hypothetical protein Tco_1358819 [Tanacetum coccineum]